MGRHGPPHGKRRGALLLTLVLALSTMILAYTARRKLLLASQPAWTVAPPWALLLLRQRLQMQAHHQPQAQPAPGCELDLENSPWEQHCQRLRHVCVDQGQLVLYDGQYQETGGRPAEALPQLLVSSKKVYAYPWRAEGPHDTTQSGRGSAAEDGSSSGSGGGGASTSTSMGQQPRRLIYELQAGYRRRLPPVPMRPASAQEPRPYLQHPSFSTCTVPVLLFVTWRNNLFHVMDDASVWHAMARRTSWRQHLKPVVVTPEGLALTPVEAGLLPALSNLTVQSLADFSTRLPAGHSEEAWLQDGQQQRQRQQASYEGGEQRCFRDVYFCGQKVPVAHPYAEAYPGGKEDARMSRGVPRELFGWGQMVVQHTQQQQQQQQHAAQQQQQQQQQQHAAQQQQQQQQQAPLPGQHDNQQGRQQLEQLPWSLPLLPQALQPLLCQRPPQPQHEQQQQQHEGPQAAASRGASGAHSKGSRRLKVVLVQRDSGGRQLLNMEELVQACNSWQYTPTSGGGTVTADCWQEAVPTVEAGIAVAQEADVLIGMHGANMANSWWMRPGSSAIEILPYQFQESTAGALSLSAFNSQDPTSRLLWWVAVVCDPALSTPGPEERAGTGNEKWWPRDRSVRMPWRALREVLEAVVAAGGDREQYIQEQYLQRRHRFNLGAEGVLSRGRGCPT